MTHVARALLLVVSFVVEQSSDTEIICCVLTSGFHSQDIYQTNMLSIHREEAIIKFEIWINLGRSIILWQGDGVPANFAKTAVRSASHCYKMHKRHKSTNKPSSLLWCDCITLPKSSYFTALSWINKKCLRYVSHACLSPCVSLCKANLQLDTRSCMFSGLTWERHRCLQLKEADKRTSLNVELFL